MVTIFACGGLDKLGEDIYTITPKPLEVHGGKVKVDVQATFAPKIFPKNVIVSITPILLSSTSEDSKKYPNVTVQGEEAVGNNEVIPNKEGKTVSYTGEVPYAPVFKESNLYAYVVATQGDKKQDFNPILISKGIITTSLLVKKDVKPILGVDKFEKIFSYNKTGDIKFLKNSSAVRNSELREEDFVAISEILKAASKNPKLTIKNISLTGFASPEGEATLNENLSINRAKQVDKKLQQIFRRSRLSKAKLREIKIYKKGEGADWNSFDAMLSQSTLEDKETIKRSIDEKGTLAGKEAVLSSMENTYPEIEKILKDIRRSEIKINYDIKSKSDEEILALIENNPKELLLEELVYGANKLLTDYDKKISAYKNLETLFPTDYRGSTNIGVLLFNKGEVDKAAEYFNKAYEIEKNEITSSNLAIINILNNKNDDAIQLLSSVSIPEAKYNKGILQIMLGDYEKAINNMTGMNTFNLALAKRLNKDFDGSIATLDAGDNKGGLDDYLRAINKMRTGKKEEAKKLLESAESKEAGLMEKAKKDLEFDGLFGAPVVYQIDAINLKKRAIETINVDEELEDPGTTLEF